MNYTVLCSGDVTCPPNFTTTDNATRSYTIHNLTTMTTYTFSVVATNSVGSGKAGIASPGNFLLHSYIYSYHVYMFLMYMPQFVHTFFDSYKSTHKCIYLHAYCHAYIRIYIYMLHLYSFCICKAMYMQLL